MLSNFGILARTAKASIYRGASPTSERGVRTIGSLGIQFFYKLHSERLTKDAVEAAATMGVTLRQATIDPARPNVVHVRHLVHVMRANLIEGSSVFVGDLQGRDRVNLIAGAWRLIVDRWSLHDTVQEMREFGIEWIKGDALTAINDCLTDIAEDVTRREEVARG